MAAPDPRLLVFDNCEDEALLAAQRPVGCAAGVLLTSRRQRWSRALGVTALQLGVLTRIQSIALLRKHRPDLAAAAGAIAAALGGLRPPCTWPAATSFSQPFRN